MLTKIVSGGQTGVDRAALDAAQALGFPCGGWCPKGRRAEDGTIPSRYPLQETTSAGYAQRTAMNVADSDGTLILARGALRGGTALTAQLAQKKRRPCRVVLLDRGFWLQETMSWLEANRIAVLNVAGPRESQCPGIYLGARSALEAVIREAHSDGRVDGAGAAQLSTTSPR